MGLELEKLHSRLRDLSKISQEYKPDHERAQLHAYPTELRGYSEATLTLAVYKTIYEQRKFAYDQHQYMTYLGEEVCPKILAADMNGYFMEYLFPAELNIDSLVLQEGILTRLVWNRHPTWPTLYTKEWRAIMKQAINVEVPDWAIADTAVIHGDPTLDNVLMTKQGFVRITDPIPPRWLKKPSIVAVDHGKMLQSLLGWEVVLRGVPLIRYSWPNFMLNDYWEVRRAIFWAMVAVKRIAYRDISDRVTQWSTIIGKKLEVLCES